MNTYLLRFETKPTIGGENLGKFAGANWTVWVVSENVEDAMSRATDYAMDRGWQFEGGKDIHIVERAHFADDVGLLHMFDTAQREGIAVLIDAFRKRITESN